MFRETKPEHWLQTTPTHGPMRMLLSSRTLPQVVPVLLVSVFVLSGCRPQSTANSSASKSPIDSAVETPVEESLPDPVAFDQTFEVDAENLLKAALSPTQLEEGWVSLFDGQSPFGWFVVGNKADWRIEEGVVRVSRGEKSFLCSTFQIADYELQLEFRSEKDTNSGVFLRTKPQPESVATDCLELNIAPPSNPFPTGSFVQRKKLEPAELGDFDPTQWHTYRVKLEGRNVQVFLDDELILEHSDFDSARTGHISLQHNSGKVEFRNILLRPLNAEKLPTNKEWEEAWDKSVKEGASLEVTATDSGLRLEGGLGQLQSKEDFQDFFLQASYTLAEPTVNGGIFFRCIRDNMLDGYECQVNHAVEEEDLLRPADAGAGAIFRRTDARIVVGDGTEKTYLSLLANGPQFVTWVNGIQVAEFYDSREPNENPRRGLRLEGGPISIQAHDPATKFDLHDLQVSPIRSPE